LVCNSQFSLDANLRISSFKKSPFKAGKPKTCWFAKEEFIIPAMVPPVPTEEHTILKALSSGVNISSHPLIAV